LDAALRCPVFDAQCEDNRAAWIAELVDAANMRDEVLEGLRIPLADDEARFWDRNHRCGMLKELAVRGVAGAREFLYNSVRCEAEFADVVGWEEVIDLDGVDGLLFVCRTLGRHLKQAPDFWVDELPMAFLDERLGEGAAEAALTAAAATDDDLAAYLEALRSPAGAEGLGCHEVPLTLDSSRRTAAVPRFDATATEVIAAARGETTDRFYWLTTWARQAPEDAVAAVFQSLLEEPALECKARLLRTFVRTAPPSYDPRLLAMLDSAHAEVRWLTARALSHLAHPDIRRAAFRKLERQELGEGAVRLLKHSQAAGDLSRVAQLLRPLSGDSDTHSLVYDVLEVVKANTAPDATDALIFVYEQSPCSNCRHDAVEHLVSLETLPAWIEEEARFDALEETRALLPSACR
jgi:hypothetical protein